MGKSKVVEESGTRNCPRCGKKKKIEEFSASCGWCRECRKAYARSPACIKGGKKRCTKCGKWLDVGMFFKNSSSRLGLSYQCKSCNYEYIKAIRRKRKDEALRGQRERIDKAMIRGLM